MASQSQWLPGNSLKTARALAKGLELCQGVNSGVGVVAPLSFSSQRDCARAGKSTYGSEETLHHFSPENKRWPIEVKCMSYQVEQYRFSWLKTGSSGFQILKTGLLPASPNCLKAECFTNCSSSGPRVDVFILSFHCSRIIDLYLIFIL